MTCLSSEALFEGFLDGDLSPRERAGLLAHVDRCTPCRTVLEELRVVDALLMTPRDVRLAPNFTFATMADVRALPPPRAGHAPAMAYLVSYLVAAWLVIAAAWVLSPGPVYAVFAAVLNVGRSFWQAAAAVVAVLTHGAANPGGLVGGIVAVDAVLLAALVAGFAYVRPRFASRRRS